MCATVQGGFYNYMTQENKKERLISDVNMHVDKIISMYLFLFKKIVKNECNSQIGESLCHLLALLR